MSMNQTPTPADPATLTGARAAVWTALKTHPGETVAALAAAAAIGRSTAGKALVTLEQDGLTRRDPGETVNGHRTPDRWHPAPPAPASAATTLTDPDTANEPPAGTAPSDDPAVPMPENHPANVTAKTTSPSETPSPETVEGPPTTLEPQRPILTTVAGGKKRLAPGSLRQLVTDHLRAHPGQAFTATAISRRIDKSSGAIANALDRLVAQGIAEQVTAKPRTYRLNSAFEADE
ncbi:helix-turn-helix domain-containing protein [Actinacidiphila sp. bgisy167]|uniref:helix-turn-helix domain-containing protein n=1 Tax=Actinacidiphila sp. bgisy167 TaxID=3413797 RepID=UPI003D722ADC